MSDLNSALRTERLRHQATAAYPAAALDLLLDAGGETRLVKVIGAGSTFPSVVTCQRVALATVETEGAVVTNSDVGRPFPVVALGGVRIYGLYVATHVGPYWVIGTGSPLILPACQVPQVDLHLSFYHDGTDVTGVCSHPRQTIETTLFFRGTISGQLTWRSPCLAVRIDGNSFGDLGSSLRCVDYTVFELRCFGATPILASYRYLTASDCAADLALTYLTKSYTLASVPPPSYSPLLLRFNPTLVVNHNDYGIVTL